MNLISIAEPARVMTPPPASEPRELRFQFTGNTGEYFRIWIVNTLLSILTLGIYSAWAKVRTRQYFYAHTKLDGSSFEYLANPVKVLIGRVIAVLALALLLGSQYYSLPVYLVVLGLFVLAMPWVLVKALAFNAHNSAYRNIRFAFTGGPGEAFGRYLGMLLVYAATCGLGLPYAQWNMTSFIVTRHLFGDLRPEWVTKPGQYFRVYLLALLISLPAYGLLVTLVFLNVEAGQSPGELQSAMLAPLIAVYAFLLVPAAFINARIANLVYGGIRLGEHRLSCQQRGRDILWLYASNLVAILCTLGLAIPWAKVRLARYRAECLTLWAAGPLRLERLFETKANAVGEGFTDLGDVGFDIGI
jgi:uncharacterized membrane protein YjgN (DUF898 family)